MSSGLTAVLGPLDGVSKLAPSNKAPEQTVILTTSSSHYNVSGSVGSDHKTMMPKPVVVYTGSGYNVIHQDALPPVWERHITHSADLPALGNANNNPLCVRHEVRLPIRLGDAVYPVCFIVVNRLAGPVLLGTHFLDQHADAIKCKQLVLYLTRSIEQILGVGKAVNPHQEQPAPDNTGPELEINHREPKKPPASARIRLCRHLRLPPSTQVKAQMVTQSGGSYIPSPGILYTKNTRCGRSTACTKSSRKNPLTFC